MEVIYRADDGTEFEDEEECAEYESRHKLAEANLLFFSTEFRVTDNIEEALFVYATDKGSAKFFEELNDEAGFNKIRSFTNSSLDSIPKVVPGIYYWEELSDSFELLDDKFASLSREIADIQAEARTISELAAQIRKEHK